MINNWNTSLIIGIEAIIADEASTLQLKTISLSFTKWTQIKMSFAFILKHILLLSLVWRLILMKLIYVSLVLEWRWIEVLTLRNLIKLNVFILSSHWIVELILIATYGKVIWNRHIRLLHNEINSYYSFKNLTIY